jgi:hypothetical protein
MVTCSYTGSDGLADRGKNMAHMPDMREQQWLSVILTNISISNSIVTVSDTFGLHPKAAISLTLGPLQGDFEIKRVLSNTQIEIGNIGTGIKGPFLSPTQFDGGTLTMSEQNRNKFGSELVLRAVYQEEPALALRTMAVDPYGQAISASNPLPVSVSGTSGATIPDSWEEIDMSYDNNNNLITVVFQNPVPTTLTLSYDPNGNLTKVVPS